MATKRNAQDDSQNGDTTAAVEEIINADPKTLRPAQRAVLELLSWLENIATEDTTDATGGFFGDDIAAILTAPDEATMLEADELPRYNAKVLSGCELDIYGIEAKFSDSPEIVSGLIGPQTNRKMYLLVRSARLNKSGNGNVYKLPEVGEEFVWNTSARFIVAKLYWYAVRGRFDNGGAVKMRIQGTDLGAGKSVEKLKALDSPVLAGTTDEAPF
jgi:hypothetical protein